MLMVNVISVISLGLHLYIRLDLYIGFEIHFHSQLLSLSRNYNGTFCYFVIWNLGLGLYLGFDLRLSFYL